MELAERNLEERIKTNMEELETTIKELKKYLGDMSSIDICHSRLTDLILRRIVFENITKSREFETLSALKGGEKEAAKYLAWCIMKILGDKGHLTVVVKISETSS